MTSVCLVILCCTAMHFFIVLLINSWVLFSPVWSESWGVTWVRGKASFLDKYKTVLTFSTTVCVCVCILHMACLITQPQTLHTNDSRPNLILFEGDFLICKVSVSGVKVHPWQELYKQDIPVARISQWCAVCWSIVLLHTKHWPT